eukprot:6049377-Prymnesium_polylepis.1
MRLSEEAKRERAEAKRAERVAKLDGRSGFLRVWKLLTAARKPMVGHNCTRGAPTRARDPSSLTLIPNPTLSRALVARVAQGPLPATLGEFKASLHRLLPHVWDTKLLSSRSGSYKDTALGLLYDACAA